jgi:hypothetical protein
VAIIGRSAKIARAHYNYHHVPLFAARLTIMPTKTMAPIFTAECVDTVQVMKSFLPNFRLQIMTRHFGLFWLATQVTPGGRDTKLCLLPVKHVQDLTGGLDWVGKVGVLKPEVRCFSRRPFAPSLLYTDTTCRMTTGDGLMYDVKPSGSCSSYYNDRSVCGRRDI